MSFGPRYYSPSGEPMEVLDWAELFESSTQALSPESWWRKRTDLDDDVRVSTVWLGIDHNWTGVGPPLIWETMIFGGEHDESQWRYSSRQAAFDDHERIVKALREGRDPDGTP